ncbi:hypothetical protein LINPERHAP1_LOCUS29293 [Linum perenne]
MDIELEHIVRVHDERLYLQTNRNLRFDTSIFAPSEFGISPTIDAKLDAGVVTLSPSVGGAAEAERDDQMRSNNKDNNFEG